MRSATPDLAGSNGHRTQYVALDDAASRLPSASKHRRPGLAVAGAVLVLGCALLGGVAVTHGRAHLQVLALARPVGAGQRLTASDLSVARVAGSGFHAIAVRDESRVIGESLTASLPAGTLLTAGMLEPTSVPGPGQVEVAVGLKPGAFPPDLAVGRAVSVLQVPSNGLVSGRSGVLVSRALVVDAHRDSLSGLTVVSVVVPDSDAVSVAQSAAAGAVSLLLLPVAP